jgi:hypothetical protein
LAKPDLGGADFAGPDFGVALDGLALKAPNGPELGGVELCGLLGVRAGGFAEDERGEEGREVSAEELRPCGALVEKGFSEVRLKGAAGLDARGAFCVLADCDLRGLTITSIEHFMNSWAVGKIRERVASIYPLDGNLARETPDFHPIESAV